MPSPFPGMNPYLEQDDAWHDFHERFIPFAAELIGAQVQPNYIVKIDEHVYIHEHPQESARFLGRPDLALVPTTPREPAQAAGLIDAPASIRLQVFIDFERLNFIEIRDRRSRELITVVELLSPSNKRMGPDREMYLSKRRKVLASPAHFVEIDLLRGGAPMPDEDRQACDYAVMVSRAEVRPDAGFWPIRLRERLPVIPIPLRAPDPNARLDIQQVLDHIYDRGGYAYYIYDGAPEPPLRPEDAEWARGLVPARG
jgi:Protein of unknown function (DUF4058)